MQPLNSINQAKIAIRAGHLAEARRLLRQLVRDEPQNYVAWLLLARATPSPQAAMAYVKRAEALRPNSDLVQRELRRLNKNSSTKSVPVPRSRWRTYLLLSSALAILLLLAVWFVPSGWEQVAALKDADSSVITALLATTTPVTTNNQTILLVTDEPTLLPTPTLIPVTIERGPAGEDGIEQTPVDTTTIEDVELTAALDSGTGSGLEIDDETDLVLAVELAVEESTEIVETDAITETVEFVPIVEAVAITETVESTAVAEEIVAPEIVESVPAAVSNDIRPYGVGPAERWIDVNLYTQTLVAYEGDTPVFDSLISSGLWNTPTVTGQYRTNMKYESQDMNGYAIGYDYYLQDVPYVMYFFEDYAIHGAYWHNSFGSPMSHGCVNMNPADAGWLYNWAPVGTTVNIHD